jgi:soluble lytic murein transglycosylase-like protein
MKTIIVTVVASFILLLPLAKPKAQTTNVPSPQKVILDASTAANPTPSSASRAKMAASVPAARVSVLPATTKQATPPAASGQAVPAVSPSQTPTPAAVSYTSGCNTYRAVFEKYSWNVSIAMAICQAESGGNPYAKSDTNDEGIMQIHDGLALYGDEIYNPNFNISIAYKKYIDQGWEAWTTYNDSAFEAYL